MKTSALLFVSLAAIPWLASGCGQNDTGQDGSPDVDSAIVAGEDLIRSQSGDMAGDMAGNLTGRDMATGPATPIKTVFLILLENHSWSEIKGSAGAPYINNTLLPMGAHAEAYRGPNMGGLHPSEPNYIWLEAGDNLGVSNDNDPSSNHQNTTSHLVTLLEAKSLSWLSYQEDITAGTCPVTSVKQYAPKHNPMLFFDDVINYAAKNTPDPAAPRCLAHVKALPALATDLTNNAVAQYNFITPNLCNDMHTSCAPTNDEVKQGDAWLATWIPLIMASDAYKKGGAIFITWDESEPLSAACFVGNCPIGMVVLSPNAKVGYSNSIAYDHSSTLKTVQEIFGVTPLLRHAADANVTDLADLFKTFP